MTLSNCYNKTLWPEPSHCEFELTTMFTISPKTFKFQVSTLSNDSKHHVLIESIARYSSLSFLSWSQYSRGTAEPLGMNDVFMQPIVLKELLITITTNTSGIYKTLESDESYFLNVSSEIATLVAPTVWGAMYGLDTFSQLIEQQTTASPDITKSWFVTGPVVISDAPRFQWRGLLLDTANHFFRLSEIESLLDGMAFNKLNVFHWHIVDSYSFPFCSSKLPQLCQGAWDANLTYSVENVKSIIAYANVRGIRVVPELEVPGHAYSWGFAFPSITADCPAQFHNVDIGWVNSVPLDPSQNLTYSTVQTLLAEFADLFPDRFVHLGGDELQLQCWNHSNIFDWMNRTELGSFLEVWEYFESWVMAQTLANYKSPLVWEETFQHVQDSLDTNTIVEVWSNSSVVEAALAEGFDVLLANGWYLDRQVPVDGMITWEWQDTWKHMYLVDPLTSQDIFPEGATFSAASASIAGSRHATGRLSDDAESRGTLIGGEANMWSEQISVLDVDARVW
jgi:hexosaminidase